MRFSPRWLDVAHRFGHGPQTIGLQSAIKLTFALDCLPRLTSWPISETFSRSAFSRRPSSPGTYSAGKQLINPFELRFRRLSGSVTAKREPTIAGKRHWLSYSC